MTRIALSFALSLFAMTMLANEASARRMAPRPLIERVTPTGNPGEFEIVGRNLGRMQFFLGPVNVPVVERQTYRVRVVVPPTYRPTGGVRWRMQGPAGQFLGPAYVAPQQNALQITSVTPPTAAPGSEVVIHGRGFGVRPGQNLVLFGGQRLIVRNARPNQLRVILPRVNTTGQFEVQVGAARAVSQPYTVMPGITIQNAQVMPDRTIMIQGAGFTPDVMVRLARRPLRILEVSPNQIRAVMPRRRGRGELTVQRPDGSIARFGMGSVQVLSPLQVLSISPMQAAPGSLLVIQGMGFGVRPRQVQVSVGGVPFQVQSVTDREIRVLVPPRPVSGLVMVTIRGQQAQSTQSFNSAAGLQIAGISPQRGAPGTEVSIRGSGFHPVAGHNLVTLNGVQAQVIRATPNELIVRIPNAQSGLIEVHVGALVARSQRPFVIAAPPSIHHLEPMAGPPGSLVIVHGSGFGNRPRLVHADIGGVPAQVRGVQDGRLELIVPPNARSGRITVEVGLRGGAASPQQFQVVTTQAAAANIMPQQVYPGVEVTIRGRGFPRSQIFVGFAGARRPVPVQRVSPVELRAIVPAGAQTGPVSLLLPGGQTMPVGMVTVGAAPQGLAITHIEAQCPFVGCRAVIHGHGFDPRISWDRLRFGGRRVRVLSATANTMTIELPNTPMTDNFVLRIRRQRAVSAPFTVQPRQGRPPRRPRRGVTVQVR